MAATYHAGYGWPVDDEPRETIAAVVLAAGAGRRFGGPKQLHLIDGTTMLERVLTAVERSGIATRLVVLGARAMLDPRAIRRIAAAGRGVRAADYGRGRSHPVVLPRACWTALPEVGDTPARDLETRLIDCRGLPEPGDVDYAAP